MRVIVEQVWAPRHCSSLALPTTVISRVVTESHCSDTTSGRTARASRSPVDPAIPSRMMCPRHRCRAPRPQVRTHSQAGAGCRTHSQVDAGCPVSRVPLRSYGMWPCVCGWECSDPGLVVGRVRQCHYRQRSHATAARNEAVLFVHRYLPCCEVATGSGNCREGAVRGVYLDTQTAIAVAVTAVVATCDCSGSCTSTDVKLL